MNAEDHPLINERIYAAIDRGLRSFTIAQQLDIETGELIFAWPDTPDGLRLEIASRPGPDSEPSPLMRLDPLRDLGLIIEDRRLLGLAW